MRPRPSARASFSSSRGDANIPRTNRHPKGSTRSAIRAPFRAPPAMSSKDRIRRDMTPLPSRLHHPRRPTPEVVVGQMRAAPPAVDRVVAGKIFLVGDDGPAEFGQRQATALVGFIAIAQILPAHVAQLLLEARDPGRRAERAPVEQVAVFEFVEHTRLTQCLTMEKRIGERMSPRYHLQHPYFAGAETG